MLIDGKENPIAKKMVIGILSTLADKALKNGKMACNSALRMFHF
jgi:hypothetical protein